MCKLLRPTLYIWRKSTSGSYWQKSKRMSETFVLKTVKCRCVLGPQITALERSQSTDPLGPIYSTSTSRFSVRIRELNSHTLCGKHIECLEPPQSTDLVPVPETCGQDAIEQLKNVKKFKGGVRAGRKCDQAVCDEAASQLKQLQGQLSKLVSTQQQVLYAYSRCLLSSLWL